jgi:cation diffusion facilitator CzcD-associated flavoprotein CzcO
LVGCAVTVAKVCIIGAGSSGIAACQVLQARGIEFDCFEKGSGIGGNWRWRGAHVLPKYVASTRHTIQVDFHAYMHRLTRERKRSRGVGRPLPVAAERPRLAARAA